MLETFTCATFEPHLGETFRLGVEPGVQVELIEATVLPTKGAARPREPFSLVFRERSDRVLPQATYPLEHPAIGAFELFLVPIGRDADGTRYEAVFT